ncbi:hypothetical protein V6N13_050077 [Hibiscus sabdariffa]|uniref:Uncharacterized protein n=1 Tax=Hibiscus sabdariffa TaxID=183260 RepID=A0ABR2QVB4_9ROSI
MRSKFTAHSRCFPPHTRYPYRRYEPSSVQVKAYNDLNVPKTSFTKEVTKASACGRSSPHILVISLLTLAPLSTDRYPYRRYEPSSVQVKAYNDLNVPKTSFN